MSQVTITLTLAPQAYNQQTMNTLIRQIQQAFTQVNSPDAVIGTTLTISKLPSSSTGLKSGSVWYDPAASNVLKYVP